MIWKTILAVCFVCIFLTLAATPAEAQQYPTDRQRIRCESNNGARNQCNANIGSDVRIIRQLSDTQCVEGRNWGWDRNGIWVDNGCRADFEFSTFSSDSRDRNRDWNRDRNQGQYGRNRGGYDDTQTLTCESMNNRRRMTQCRANIAGDVRLIRQLSDVQCIEGRNWGWKQNHIWVRNGCRAEFEYRELGRPGRRMGQGQGGYGNRGGYGNTTGSGTLETLTCESENDAYRECRVNQNISDVRVVQRLSNSTCEQGSSWGLKNDQQTIWVNHGCRAVFQFRR